MEYEEVVVWDAPEYHYTEKTADWYWVLGIIAAALVIIFIVFNNILLAILVALAAFVIGLYAHRKPEIVHHELQLRGVLVGDSFYEYHSLDSFWIENDPVSPKIILKSKKLLMPYIIIPAEDVSLNELHDYLIRRLPAVEHHEPVAYRVFEYFGF
jgi:hypothetical protein